MRVIIGDATAPVGDGERVIAHVCNNVGAWGAGFVLALERRWPGLGAKYRAASLKLGDVQIHRVEPGVSVANMIAMHGLASRTNPVPLGYGELRACLVKLRGLVPGASVHMPKIGAGLAGGDWARISALIDEELVAHGVEVTVYELPARPTPQLTFR